MKTDDDYGLDVNLDLDAGTLTINGTIRASMANAFSLVDLANSLAQTIYDYGRTFTNPNPEVN